MKYILTLEESNNNYDWKEDTNCDDVKDILYGFHDDFYTTKIKNKMIHIQKDDKIDLDSFSENYKKLSNDIKGLGYTVTSNNFEISNESASVHIKYIDESIENFKENDYKSFIYKLKNHVFYQSIYDWGKVWNGHEYVDNENTSCIQFQISQAFSINSAENENEKRIHGKFSISFNTNYFKDSLIKEYRDVLFGHKNYDCNLKNYQMVIDIILMV